MISLSFQHTLSLVELQSSHSVFIHSHSFYPQSPFLFYLNTRALTKQVHHCSKQSSLYLQHQVFFSFTHYKRKLTVCFIINKELLIQSIIQINNQSINNPPHSHSSNHCFPLNNFKYSFTLFSKFFSSFPHGTCSLSVSRSHI